MFIVYFLQLNYFISEFTVCERTPSMRQPHIYSVVCTWRNGHMASKCILRGRAKIYCFPSLRPCLNVIKCYVFSTDCFLSTSLPDSRAIIHLCSSPTQDSFSGVNLLRVRSNLSKCYVLASAFIGFSQMLQ